MSRDRDRRHSRRFVLKTGAGGALGGLLAASGNVAGEESRNLKRNVYESLGIKPFINAAGTITTLGGSLMPPEVVEAWGAASQSFVDLVDLQEKIGEKIASLLNVEAALVTTGAAGGIAVGTAAAVTYRDHSLIGRLPLSGESAPEVIIETAHRSCYDQQMSLSGVKFVEVNSREGLEKAINSRTAMMMSYNYREPKGKLRHREWLEVARARKVPTLLDAAADTPPVKRLWEYNHMGYDMVAFSGGKAIRGPQGAGLLLGRKDLITAARMNTSPQCKVGRGMKVSKEDMVAMWAAVERFVSLDHEAERREWERRISVIEDAVKSIPTVTTERVVPRIANKVPHLIVEWDEQKLKLSHAQATAALRDGEPSIRLARVGDTGDRGILISVFVLEPGEEKIVARRLSEVLG